MNRLISLPMALAAAIICLCAGVATAQHDAGAGGSKDVAGGESTSRAPVTRRTPTRPTSTPPRRARTPAPVRRGTTAEQYNQQGDSLFEGKQYDDALEAYQKAVQLKPIASAYYHIGWIYNDRNDYDQAVTALQQAIRYDANDSAAFYELGYAYRNLKRFDDALAAYRRSIAIKPDRAAAYYEIGWIYNEQGQYAQAIPSLRQAATLRDGYADAYEEMGYAYYKLNQSQEAITAYQQAVRMKPDYGLAYLGLGDVYFYQTKQYAQAAESYRQGTRFKTDNATAFYNLAWADNELNQFPEAVTAARQAIALKANYPEAFNEMGYANRKLAEAQPKNSAEATRLYNEALANYRQAIQLRPCYGLAYVGLGDTYYDGFGNCQQAIPPYEQAARIAPNNVRLHYRLGWCYNDTSRYQDAAMQLAEATRLKPEAYDAHTELGYANYKLGRLPMAVEELRTAIRLKGDYALAHYYLGLVFIQQGNKAGAQTQYGVLRRLDPARAQQLYNAAPPNMRN